MESLRRLRMRSLRNNKMEINQSRDPVEEQDNKKQEIMSEKYLRVLEEGVLVVGTAPRSVEKWIVVATPRAPHHSFFPGLMETQIGCVDETTEDEGFLMRIMGAPELIAVIGVAVYELSVHRGQPVIDHHVHPLTKPPEPEVKDPSVRLRIKTLMSDMEKANAPSNTMVLPFKEDTALTEMMRLRVSSLQRSGQKRQDGERLLLPHEAVYRLDFNIQELNFSRWYFSLSGHGRVTITGISQHWTPDLTNLMTRQLLEPIGTFWRNANDPDDSPLKCLEADMQEFGERIAELAKVRKVMYFLFAFREGAEAANLSCSNFSMASGPTTLSGPAYSRNQARHFLLENGFSELMSFAPRI
ncbi:hypothetical protein INR49_003627 [Caranx melampygus]|nr:hypothetical protein INR49_003627 [Caranx melampygus]